MFTQCGLNSERTFKENVGLFREKNAKRDRPFHDNASEQEEWGGGRRRRREKREETYSRKNAWWWIADVSICFKIFIFAASWLGRGRGGNDLSKRFIASPPPPSLLPFDRSNAADSLNNARGAGVVWEGGRREGVGGS